MRALNTSVRRFRLADLNRILKIESEAFAEDAYTREMFLDLDSARPGLFFVATRGGRVVGYIVTQASGRKAEIISIAVEAEHRGKGAGKALMMKTIAKLTASGIRQVRLAVRPSNRTAVRFYRTVGFVPAGRMTRYYADGGDALQMRLILAETVSGRQSPASGDGRR